MQKSKKINIRSLYLSLILGLIFLLPNIYAALSTQSLALWTNCFLSIGYILTSALSLFAYKAQHNKKLDSFISRVMSIFFLVIIAFIWFNIYLRLQQPITHSSISFAILLLSLYVVINSYMFFRTYYYGSAENSSIVLTQSNIYLVKLGLNITIIVSLLITDFLSTNPWSKYFDPVCSLLLSLFILSKAKELYTRSKNS